MFTIHEGEIIYKEKYGSFPKQRFYVKPPEQGNMVILDEEKSNDFTNLFTRVFLPQGYPNSVSRDYINYQIWDTAQAFCSTIMGILATQEVLRGVGVGDTSATPLAATVTWVLKDGCGHVGRILFAFSHGTHLDAYSKKWRLYADTLNDAAMCIEITLPVFKNYTTFVLCISTMMKAIVGVAGGATRAAMTQHHAIRGNLADVAAKDSAQETAVNLVASIIALLIISLFGNSLTIFLILMVFHIIFNYFAVRSVCLRTLNEPRFLQIIDTYLRQEAIAHPCDVNRHEPIILNHGPQFSLDQKLCGFRIKMGHSMKKIVKMNPKASYMTNVQDVYKLKEFIILPCIPNRIIYVFLRDSVTNDDVMRAYLQAVLFGIIICAINDYDLPIYKNPDNAKKPFPRICETLQQAEWSKEAMENPGGKFNYEPSFELMIFLNRTVDIEWPKIKEGLQQIGWDLKKHLIIVDEWRICTAKLVARQISIGQQVIPELLAHAASKIMTFGNQPRANTVGGRVDVNTYTIEPENKISEEAADTLVNCNESRSEATYSTASPSDTKTTKKD